MDLQAKPISFGLSAGQMQIWLAEQFDVGDTAYSLNAFSELFGPCNTTLLEQAARAVIAAAETLRLRFFDDTNTPCQSIDAGLSQRWQLPFHDLSNQSDPLSAAWALARSIVAERYRIEDHTPLFRWHLIRVAPEHHVWLQTYHHLIADGLSRQRIREMMAAEYTALAEGTPPPSDAMVPLPDLLHDPNYTPQGTAWTQDRDHWLQILADRPPAASLSDRSISNRRIALHITRRLAPPVRDGLDALARETGASLPSVLTAAAASYVAHFTVRDEFVLGWAVSARTGAAARRTPAMMSNIVPLRLACSASDTLGDFILSTAKRTASALRHQRFPLMDLRQALGIPPLAPDPFETIINVVPYERDVSFAGTLCRTTPISEGPVFDLEITLRDRGADGLHLSLFGNVDRYTPDELSAHADRLGHRLSQFAAHRADDLLRDLPLIDAAERASILRKSCGEAVELDPQLTLLSLLDAQRARTPEATALVFRDQSISLATLHDRADRLACLLQAKGVQPDDIVAVLIDRSIEQIVAMLAVLKSGAGYLPLDCSYPAERLAMMLEDAAPRLTISMSGLIAARALPTTATLCLDDPAITQRLAQFAPDPRPAATVRPEHLAYVIYTSGSTGKPKGVLTAHRAIVNRLLWKQNLLRLTTADRVLQKTPIGFDVSVWEWILPLMTGATLVISEPDGHRDPAHLLDMIERHGVTVLHFVPSVLSAFLEGLSAGECKTLRHIVTSGEALGGPVRESALQRLPHAALWNLYGPTEAAIDVTFWRCHSQPETESTPIGHPIWNTQIYLLNAALQPVPDGAVGELYIGGVNIARGYLARPDLTAERFVPCPFGPPGARMYRTGDLARRREDGVVLFLGRADDQFKLNGMRVEPGEIEAITGQAFPDQVAQIAVVPALGPTPRLVAYIVPRPGAVLPEPAVMMAVLAERLPPAMVPAAFVAMDALPLTANGKLDRGALANIAVTLSRPAFRPPQSALEKQICTLFTEATGAERVGIDDSFFDIGGDSLLIMRLVSRARAAGLALSVRDVLRHQTPARLAALLIDGEAGLPTTTEAHSSAPVFVIPGAGGDLPMMALLRTRCAAAIRIVDLEIDDWDALTNPDYRLENLVARLKHSIAAQAPTGKLRLAGYSLGGQMAWAIASAFEREGREVEHVVLIDSCSIKRLVSRLHEKDNEARHLTLKDELVRLWQARAFGRTEKELARIIARRLLNPRFGWALRWLARNRRALPGWEALELDLRVEQFVTHSARWCADYDDRATLAAPVTLLRAQDTTDPDWDLGWKASTAQISVVNVAGDHLSVLSIDRVDTVAVQLIRIFG